MNKTFNDVTILGRIIFSDGKYFDQNNLSSLKNITSFERNEVAGTTSLLQDELIINQKITTNTHFEAPLAVIDSLIFRGDLNDEGLPNVQNKAFSELVRQRLENVKSVVDSIVPDIIEPAQKKLKVSHLDVDHESGAKTSVYITDDSYNDFVIAPSTGIVKITKPLDVGGNFINSATLLGGHLENDLQIMSYGAGGIKMFTGSTERFSIESSGIINFGTASFNPSNTTLTCTNLSGTATNSNNVLVTSDQTDGSYYVPFVKSSGSTQKQLYIDDVTTPLVYNPSTGSLSCTNFLGNVQNASNVTVTSDNTSGTYYIPFVKTSGDSSKSLFIDDGAGPLTYDASTASLTTRNVFASKIENPAGNLEFKVDTTGSGGRIIFTGGSGLVSTGSNKYLYVTVNGVNYRIAMQTV
jgi:hypothetical protein